jgi:hypothetical protein
MSGSVWIDWLDLSGDEPCPGEGDHYEANQECQGGPTRRSGFPSLVGGTLQSRNRRQREKCHSTSGEVVGEEPHCCNEEEAANALNCRDLRTVMPVSGRCARTNPARRGTRRQDPELQHWAP